MLAHTCNASILTCEKIYKKEININNKDGLSAYKENIRICIQGGTTLT